MILEKNPNSDTYRLNAETQIDKDFLKDLNCKTIDKNYYQKSVVKIKIVRRFASLETPYLDLII